MLAHAHFRVLWRHGDRTCAHAAQYFVESLSTACNLWRTIADDSHRGYEELTFVLGLIAVYIPMVQAFEQRLVTPCVRSRTDAAMHT